MHTAITASRGASWPPGLPPYPESGRRQHPPLPMHRQPWECLPANPGYDIRPVRTHHQHRAAAMLVRRMYSWRGYHVETAAHRLDDPHRLTLAAWQGDEVVATLTLGRDSPAGLLGDALYPREIASLRRPDRTVCEVSRLAIDPDFSCRDLQAALFRAAHQFARDHLGATDVVIEVNPRHARFYERQMGFGPCGGLRHCPRVDAPAVLLHRRLGEFAIAGNDSPWRECSNDDFYFSSADGV